MSYEVTKNMLTHRLAELVEWNSGENECEQNLDKGYYYMLYSNHGSQSDDASKSVNSGFQDKRFVHKRGCSITELLVPMDSTKSQFDNNVRSTILKGRCLGCVSD